MLTAPAESPISSHTVMGHIVKPEVSLSSSLSKAIPMPGYANVGNQEESPTATGHISNKSSHEKDRCP